LEGEIILGEVVKPHGIKGRVKVKNHAESSEIYHRAERLTFKTKEDILKTLVVKQTQEIGNCVILKLEGISSREDAEALTGSIILVSREELPVTEEDEYYWHDLLGMDVYDREGVYYGLIVNIIRTGSNDVYVVRGEKGREILVPGTYDAIHEIMIFDKKMIIEPQYGHDVHGEI